ncbi:d-amino-acid oxidase [Moniliophthora roreri MCA 2997]|uniref:D-amino-acid oxidase n=1 Tax=Moniliophthora roreri (strain MCA 2997) TaxID=1381753 RepID=V2WVQ9_MONRO|nr:d-amino-acid oxidase [Moniliophthora roreri MCA 2997]
MGSDSVKNIVVLGAGVVGLTTALRIQERGGYSVTIVAEILPTDPKSIKYTSQWAGAHHVSHAEKEPRQTKIDQETFKVFWELSAPGGPAEHCFMRLQQSEYYHEAPDGEHHLSWYPDYKILPKDKLAAGTSYGVEFSTVTIDSPAYLNYLLSRFLAAGGSITRGSVQHINQVVDGGAHIFSERKTPSPVDAIVVCLGLGAFAVGGIEDKDMYPIRGQTVVVRAPWIKFGRTISTKAGLWTYIIPRRSGDVIVGGIKDAGDWYPVPRPEITEDILERGFALCPELAPPDVRAQRTPTIDDVRPIIVEEGCGHRPARKGGIRLETLWIQGNNKKVPVVTNYGHGAAGYQSSWGSAAMALDLLEGALSQSKL